MHIRLSKGALPQGLPEESHHVKRRRRNGLCGEIYRDRQEEGKKGTILQTSDREAQKSGVFRVPSTIENTAL